MAHVLGCMCNVCNTGRRNRRVPRDVFAGQIMDDCNETETDEPATGHCNCYAPVRRPLCNTTHVRIYYNRTVGIPPGGSPDWEGYGDYRIEIRRRIVIVPGIALAASGGITQTAKFTYVGIVDDNSTNVVLWYQVKDYSFTTAVLSGTLNQVNWIALELEATGNEVET